MSYISEITQVFEQNKNSKNAEKMSNYMQNKFAFYGIQSPLRRKLQKDFLEKNNLPKLENLKAIILNLWKAEQREYQYFGIDLLKKYMNQVDKAYIDLYEKMILQKSWWDTVDLLASTLVGKLILKYPDLVLEKTDTWIKSDNIWLQRTSLLFQLKYREATDFNLLQKYIQYIVESEDFFIQKAIGWALRQYSKYSPKEVKVFLESQKLAKLSLKEASKYIDF